MQAVQELGEREQLAAVEVRRPKDLLELGVQQGSAVPQVHDLYVMDTFKPNPLVCVNLL